MSDALPSIQDIAASFSAKSDPVPGHERSVDTGTAKGGTASDPALNQLKPEAKEEIKEVVEKVEAAKEEAKKEEKRDPASARFGALARKEKELRAQQKAIEDKLKAAEDRERQLMEREQRLGVAKKNPLEILKEYGFSYQDATQAVLGGYEAPPEDPMDAKLRPWSEKVDKSLTSAEKLEKELNELKAQIAAKHHQESITQVIKEIKTTLDDDKFELTKAMGEDGVDFVREIMVEYYKANERLLDYSEACQLAEDYYEKEYLGRLMDTKKVKSRFPASTAATAATQAKPKTEAKATLTNDLVTGAGAIVDIDKLSKEDAIAHLAKKLQFKSNN